jgi:hypothetical protein
MMDFENSNDGILLINNGLATNLFLQGFAWLELDHFLRGDGDGLASLGIATLTLCSLTGGESTKTHKSYIIASLQGRGHYIDECIYRFFSISLGQTGLLCDLFY